MRTTVRMNDALLRDAKRVAAEDGLTLTAVLENAVREMLERRRTLGRDKRMPLPTFKGRGLQPGVDLDDTAALLDHMEHRDDSA